MDTTKLFLRWGARLSWPTIIFLILVLVIFAGIRSYQIYIVPTGENLFSSRYLEHPIVSGIHMLCGIIFILFAPLQFSNKFRRKHLNTHRVLGRLLVFCALIAGIYGILSITVLPVFGGLASATAGWLFGPLFLLFLARAFWSIRQKRIPQHREWMIRTLALGLGVGTQRVIIFIFIASGYQDFEAVFGPAQWLGFSINLLIAELWINLTRKKR